MAQTARKITPTTAELIQAERLRGEATRNFGPPPAVPIEVQFRHGHWHLMRDQLRRAISCTRSPHKRLERWDNCGACGVVEWSKSRQKARCTSWHCKDRLCRPCMRMKRRNIRSIIRNNVKKQRARFITLTLDHRDETLKEMMRRMKAAFGRVKRSKTWRTYVAGGICVPETKIGKDGNWHHHLHIVATGSFLPQHELADAWRMATRGAMICHIEEVQDLEGEVAYITKYVTKLTDHELMADEFKLVEFCEAMKGQRTWNIFGDWKSDTADEEDAGEKDWQPMCTVLELIAARNRNEEWAVGLTRHLQMEMAGQEKRARPEPG